MQLNMTIPFLRLGRSISLRPPRKPLFQAFSAHFCQRGFFLFVSKSVGTNRFTQIFRDNRPLVKMGFRIFGNQRINLLKSYINARVWCHVRYLVLQFKSSPRLINSRACFCFSSGKISTISTGVFSVLTISYVNVSAKRYGAATKATRPTEKRSGGVMISIKVSISPVTAAKRPTSPRMKLNHVFSPLSTAC